MATAIVAIQRLPRSLREFAMTRQGEHKLAITSHAARYKNLYTLMQQAIRNPILSKLVIKIINAIISLN